MSERNAHLVQRVGIAVTGRLVVGVERIEMAPGDNAKGGVAGHGAVQPRIRRRALPRRRLQGA